jgi:iron complex outermembrane receptor protein
VHAQPVVADARATVRVTVRHGDDAVPGAVVRALGTPATGAQTDARGSATLRLPAGPQALVTSRLGFLPDTLRLTLRAGQDTALVVALTEQEVEAEAIVVTATRGERRVEDTPLRVEVIDEEEIGEKVAMTPGDVAMMLNETSGLRVQTTNPSLGGANVRVQGLRGRYTLILADGLPLYGQVGGLGLLQIPPIDLARVEIVKGTASALYGSAALGGVVNLVSRRPSAEAAQTLLVNQTSRGGTDGVAFVGGPLATHWGYTLLGGAHRQSRQDLDTDGWADLPGYERAVVRPRLYFDDGAGRTAFLTGGLTLEDRGGGTLPGRTLPGGAGAYAEALRTGRADVGGLARWVIPQERALHGGILTVRGSAVEQRHRHTFGEVDERDRHRTAFGEAALALPRGRATYVGGVAVQQDAYRADDVADFDYTFTTPAAFAQLDVDAAPWLALSGSARADAHSVYGTFVNPRLSALLRRPGEGALAGWTVRASGGTGAFAPTPFTEETEATGLRPLEPLRGLVAERARSASLDVGGPLATALGRLELNATAFGSRVRHPLLVRQVPGAADVAGQPSRLAIANAARATVTWGADAFARLRIDDVLSGELGVLGTYVYLRAREDDPERGLRREVPLTPRHSAGLDVIWEAEGRGRLGLEFFHTGRQALADNPYRTESRPYLLVGLLGEWRVPVRGGVARLFVNGENLTGVRQTRYDPLLLPRRGQGGRWTTDVWTELAGRTINGGVRLEL